MSGRKRLFGACLGLGLAFAALLPCAAADAPSYPVEAGERGYELPIEVHNHEGFALEGVRVEAVDIPKAIRALTIDSPVRSAVASGGHARFLIRFDISDDIAEPVDVELRFRVQASNGTFDQPEPRVKLTIAALAPSRPAGRVPPEPPSASPESGAEQHQAAAPDSTSRGRDSLPPVAFLVIEVRGSGYSPSYGGTRLIEGSEERLLKVERDADPFETARAAYESLRKDTDCDHWNAWAGIGGVGRPMFWKNGPVVEILERGPYSFSETKTSVKLKRDWREIPATSAPTWKELHRRACGGGG